MKSNQTVNNHEPPLPAVFPNQIQTRPGVTDHPLALLLDPLKKGMGAIALAASALAVAFSGSDASAAQIGMNFLNGANNGNTNLNALATTDSAGAPGYAQANWNNLSGFAIAAPLVGVTNANVALVDSSGAASGVLVSWTASGTWSQNGTPPMPT
jgi:hypothetical protein